MAAFLLVLLAFLAGCGSDDGGTSNPIVPGGGRPSTQLIGTFANGSQAGSITIAIATASLAPALRSAAVRDSPVAASGELNLEAGGVVTLTGTYERGTDSLHLSGGGYTFGGYYYRGSVPPVLGGEYTGPSGAGSFGCFPGTGTTVKVFCGEFRSGTSPVGHWNLAIAGTSLMGLEAPYGDYPATGFSGTVEATGAFRDLTFSGSGTDFLLNGSGTWNTATDHVTGTWTTDDGSGTWSVTRCLPGTTGPD